LNNSNLGNSLTLLKLSYFILPYISIKISIITTPILVNFICSCVVKPT